MFFIILISSLYYFKRNGKKIELGNGVEVDLEKIEHCSNGVEVDLEKISPTSSAIYQNFRFPTKWSNDA